MSDLLTALQSAERGSRELDWRLADWSDHPSFEKRFENMWPGFGEGSKLDLAIPPYTTSIDAALALVERVLGHDNVGLCRSASGWEAWIGARQAYLTSYPTPPLALVIALVRAKETM